jgi:head-tail adaptor
MSITSAAQADTLAILGRWAESIDVHRATLTYDGAGLASESWASVGVIQADWQTKPGTVITTESGEKRIADAVIQAPAGVNVAEHDRVYRCDGSFEYVVYVKTYEDHTAIYVNRTEGSD